MSSSLSGFSPLRNRRQGSRGGGGAGADELDLDVKIEEHRDHFIANLIGLSLITALLVAGLVLGILAYSHLRDEVEHSVYVCQAAIDHPPEFVLNCTEDQYYNNSYYYYTTTNCSNSTTVPHPPPPPHPQKNQFCFVCWIYITKIFGQLY